MAKSIFLPVPLFSRNKWLKRFWPVVEFSWYPKEDAEFILVELFVTPDDVTTGVIVTPPPFSNTIGNLRDESCLLTFSMVAEKIRQIIRSNKIESQFKIYLSREKIVKLHIYCTCSLLLWRHSTKKNRQITKKDNHFLQPLISSIRKNNFLFQQQKLLNISVAPFSSTNESSVKSSFSRMYTYFPYQNFMLAAMEKFISCYSVKNNSSKCSAHFPQCENDFPPFLKKYRESNVFYEKKLYTPQYGRMNKLLSPKNISSNQLFSNFFRKTSLSRNFFQLNTKELITRYFWWEWISRNFSH